MQLTSTALVADTAIPLRHAETSADGQNLSPDLAWSGAPLDTRSFAVTCYDPDAPTGSGWWHWIAFDIPADVTALEVGAEVPGRQWENDYGYLGYGGPCPPAGTTHRYVFTVYALDIATLPVGDADQVTSAAVRFTLLDHVLDSASITATFSMAKDAGLA